MVSIHEMILHTNKSAMVLHTQEKRWCCASKSAWNCMQIKCNGMLANLFPLRTHKSFCRSVNVCIKLVCRPIHMCVVVGSAGAVDAIKFRQVNFSMEFMWTDDDDAIQNYACKIYTHAHNSIPALSAWQWPLIALKVRWFPVVHMLRFLAVVLHQLNRH